MRHNKLLLVLSGLFVFLAGAPGVFAADPLNPPLPVELWGLEFKHPTVVFSFVAAMIVFIACWFWGRGLSLEKPGRGQVFLEALVGAFDTLTRDGFGSKSRGRIFLPLLASLFLFVWMSNMMGLIPAPGFHIGGEEFVDFNGNEEYDPGEPFTDTNDNHVQDPGFFMPEPEEPTANVSTTLALALLFVLLIGHGATIRYRGVLGYFLDYFSPGGLIGVVMMPLNVIGKVAENISISFRLFGNIFGGSVILSVVCGLIHYLVMPPFLYGFFGVFVGTVQAFVFTMLAMTYISSGAAEETVEEEFAEAAN